MLVRLLPLLLVLALPLVAQEATPGDAASPEALAGALAAQAAFAWGELDRTGEALGRPSPCST